MNDKVKELVEWVAKEIGQHTENCPWEVCSGNEQEAARRSAIYVLSHPDLALIDRDFLWKIRAILRGMQIKQQSDSNITWETSLDNAIKKFDDNIIPLAEAMKELEDGRTE